MANPARAAVEQSLRARQLDRTLTTQLPSLDRTDPAACAPTDLTALDHCLQGGLPRGQLSEIAGPRSSGRTTLLLQLIAAATRRGEIAALVDTLDRLDQTSVAAAAVDGDRLLWIRGQAITGMEPAPARRDGQRPGRLAGNGRRDDLCERIVDRALKALNLVIQAGGFGLVAIDLADVPMTALRRLPFTTWMRIQRTLEGSETAGVLLASEPLARSAGGVTLSLTGRATWRGASARSRLLTGLDVATRIVSPRRRVVGDVTIAARCATAAHETAGVVAAFTRPAR